MTLLWIIVAVGSFVIELATLGNLICIWFSLGALFSLVLSLLQVNEVIQYVAFFVVSIIAMLIIRPLAHKYLRGNTVPTNSDRLIGQLAQLLEPISLNSWGKVSISGVDWSCTSEDNSDIAKDTIVKIVAIDGAKLVVKKID
ncbi:MAG: NfeD family protein [Erysipelotrichaceae bacterium]